MLEGAGRNEKLEQTDLKITAMEKLYKELTLAKDI